MELTACPKCISLLILPFLLVTLTADLTVGAPRAAQDVATLRGAGGGIRGSKGGGWGLKLDALQGSKDKNADLNEAIDVILSKNNSPSLRLFLNDKLFLRHLQLLLEQPTRKHYQQLQNRFMTLRNRRTDEVSSRFFLRD
ncbi:uncharacterized protein LOC111712391 [Eurytemora carolleeae]|uniref:uncharacterized protein LOC111712391 n=1 Tax=Eurytemora carolleeae TaxID=1294199 RepID=UPI000C77AA8B|nr:uncharacterized protein LOC111712391 [Eurytemora carolleeae]|eukprot:XP_023342745.1 uncharacterized protein LOC111712391 [Eurytemora affinis]